VLLTYMKAPVGLHLMGRFFIKDPFGPQFNGSVLANKRAPFKGRLFLFLLVQFCFVQIGYVFPFGPGYFRSI